MKLTISYNPPYYDPSYMDGIRETEYHLPSHNGGSDPYSVIVKAGEAVTVDVTAADWTYLFVSDEVDETGAKVWKPRYAYTAYADSTGAAVDETYYGGIEAVVVSDDCETGSFTWFDPDSEDPDVPGVYAITDTRYYQNFVVEAPAASKDILNLDDMGPGAIIKFDDGTYIKNKWTQTVWDEDYAKREHNYEWE